MLHVSVRLVVFTLEISLCFLLFPFNEEHFDTLPRMDKVLSDLLLKALKMLITYFGRYILSFLSFRKKKYKT